MKSFLLFFLFLIFSPSSKSDVWVGQENWSDEWETRFSEWIKSKKVHKNIFVAADSPYKGIVADCADVVYVLRAIFAFENGLNFSTKNPLASASSEVRHFSNSMTRFDHISDPLKRFVAFANYIGQILGTESLVANDSYPIELKKIIPSDMFLYKIKRNDQFVRHGYNIKNIDKRGNFEVIYSTQSIRDAGDPMFQRVKGLYNAPINYRWGFRRYDYGVSADVERSLNARGARSNEQFPLATTLGERGFFAHVKNLLKLEIEQPDSVFSNSLKEYCEQVVERINIVNKALAHQRVLKGECMNFADFDTHSTPSRDRRLKDMVTNLKLDFEELRPDQLNLLSAKTLSLLEGLFHQNPTQGNLDDLKNFCPISYKENHLVNLRDIRTRVIQGLLSSHPNDTLELRWGETTDGKTNCRTYY